MHRLTIGDLPLAATQGRDALAAVRGGRHKSHPWHPPYGKAHGRLHGDLVALIPVAAVHGLSAGLAVMNLGGSGVLLPAVAGDSGTVASPAGHRFA